MSIVRCKECKYWNSETNGCIRNPSVEAWKPDDFCSYGEHKDEPNCSEKPNNCKDEPQTDPCDGCVCDDGKHLMYCMNCKGIAWKTEPPKVETEPQTDNGIGCSRCDGRYDCYDRDMPHAVHCNNYGKVTDCSWK